MLLKIIYSRISSKGIWISILESELYTTINTIINKTIGVKIRYLRVLNNFFFLSTSSVEEALSNSQIIDPNQKIIANPRNIPGWELEEIDSDWAWNWLLTVFTGNEA